MLAPLLRAGNVWQLLCKVRGNVVHTSSLCLCGQSKRGDALNARVRFATKHMSCEIRERKVKQLYLYKSTGI
jgi:hypothetical protein